MTKCNQLSTVAARKRSLHYKEWESEMFAAGWQRTVEDGCYIWQHSVSKRQLSASQASLHWLAGTLPEGEHCD